MERGVKYTSPAPPLLCVVDACVATSVVTRSSRRWNCVCVCVEEAKREWTFVVGQSKHKHTRLEHVHAA